MGYKVIVDEIENTTHNSGLPKVNENFEKLADEFDNVLYRDGSLAATNDIDMDSNRLLNLPAPGSANEPLRLIDVTGPLAEYNVSAALRDDLEADTGSSVVVFKQAGTGSVARTVQDELRENALSITQYGASTASSGATQRVNIQKAIDAAAAAGRPLRVPSGTFNFSGGSLSIPDGLAIVGDDRLRSILNRTDAGPVLTPTTVVKPRDITLKGLQIKGGTVGFDVTASDVSTEIVVDSCFFHLNSVAGIRSNQMMITWTITNNIFDSCIIGIQNLAANTTDTLIQDNQFKELSGRSIDLRGGNETVSIRHNRFEARDLPITDTGGYVIYVELSHALTIEENYFEDTFRTILKEVASVDETRFINNRCSGQENLVGTNPVSTPKSEFFESDGIVAFGGNDFDVGTYGSEQMILSAPNRNLNSRRSWVWPHYGPDSFELCSPQIVVSADDTAYQAFLVSVNPSIETNDIAGLIGSLEIDYSTRTSANAICFSEALFHLSVMANTNVAAGVLELSSELINQHNHTATVPTFAIESVSPSTSSNIIRVRVSGIPTAMNNVGRLKLTLRGRNLNAETRPQITVTPILATGPWA